MYKVAVGRGAVSVQAPTFLEDKSGKGKVIVASIKSYDDTIHSFVQRTGFTGLFMPNYEEVKPDPITNLLGELKYSHIDHVVANHQSIETHVEYYQKILDFHKYWSIDETLLHTEYR